MVFRVINDLVDVLYGELCSAHLSHLSTFSSSEAWTRVSHDLKFDTLEPTRTLKCLPVSSTENTIFIT